MKTAARPIDQASAAFGAPFSLIDPSASCTTMSILDKPVGIGIIGCGQVAEHKHLVSLQGVPHAEVVAVADRDPDRAEKVADRFGIARCYRRVEDLLADASVDAVGICVPAGAHAEVVLAAVAAHKHLLVEKPLALHLDDCDRVIEGARHAPHLKMMVGFHMRRHRLILQAVDVLRQGTLGPIESIRTTWHSPISYDGSLPAWRYARAEGGGALAELAVHHFDLWRFLMQTEVEDVFAMSRFERQADETAVVAARLANGVLATAVFSERTSHDIDVEVCGRHGRLHLSCLRFDGLQFFPISEVPGSLSTRLKRMVHVLKELPRGLARHAPGGEYLQSYRAQWRYFIDCIRHDKPVEPTLEDGRRAVQVMLAAVESATYGERVAVERSSRILAPIASGHRPSLPRKASAS